MFDGDFGQLVQSRLGLSDDRVFSDLLAAGTDLPAVVIDTIGHQQRKGFGNERITETATFAVNYIASTYAELTQAITRLKAIDGYAGTMGGVRAVQVRQSAAFSEFEEGETLRAVFTFEVVSVDT